MAWKTICQKDGLTNKECEVKCQVSELIQFEGNEWFVQATVEGRCEHKEISKYPGFYGFVESVSDIRINLIVNTDFFGKQSFRIDNEAEKELVKRILDSINLESYICEVAEGAA